MLSEDLKKKICAEVGAYLKENIEDFDERKSVAWSRIDHNRAPLYNVSLDLHEEIEEKVVEWLWENFETEDFLC